MVTWKINRSINCESINYIYKISCNKEACKDISYIGESERKLNI